MSKSRITKMDRKILDGKITAWLSKPRSQRGQYERLALLERCMVALEKYGKPGEMYFRIGE